MGKETNDRKKIVAMMVVGPGEADRWLEPVLEQRKKLADDMVIVQNNTDPKTQKLIKKFGYWTYHDDREWGIYQPNIKTDLLAKVAKLKPDWILPSDADEIYDKYFTREEAEKLMQVNYAGYYFAIVNLWDDEEHYRHDLSFWNVRFFRYMPQFPLNFGTKKVHCGLAPAIVYKYGANAPFIVKHYGLMRAEDREKKVERYNKYDPKAIYKGREYYDKLKNNKQITTFNEDDFHAKVANEVAGLNQKSKIING